MIKIYINSKKDDEVEFKTVDFAEVNYDKLDEKYIKKDEFNSLDQKYIKRDEYNPISESELDQKYLLKSEYNPLNILDLDKKYMLRSEYQPVDTSQFIKKSEFDPLDATQFASKTDVNAINEYLDKLKNVTIKIPNEEIEELGDINELVKTLYEYLYPAYFELENAFNNVVSKEEFEQFKTDLAEYEQYFEYLLQLKGVFDAITILQNKEEIHGREINTLKERIKKLEEANNAN